MDKKVFMAYLVLSSLLFSYTLKAQENAEIIVQNASNVCISLNSIKYFINKKPIEKKTNKPIYKGVISLAKDTKIYNPIFKGYIYHSNVDISLGASRVLNIVSSYDGKDLSVIKDKELTKYSDPSATTIMKILGFELYLLIYKGFTNSDGLQFILNRELRQLPDTIINGIPSYRIEATAYLPLYSGSDETRKSITEWFFAKHNYMPIAYSDHQYFTSFQILEKDFEINLANFNLMSNELITIKEKNNQDVQEENLLAVGSIGPKWESKTLKGENVTLSDFREKIVLIDFWGTWCGPCIRSMPNIQRIKEKFDNIEVIGIAVKDDYMKVKEFIDKNAYTYTIIPEGTEIANLYKVAEYPTLYILNKKGEIIYREKGYNPKGFEEWSKVIEEHQIK